jgi:hypothetical protein
MGTYRVNASDQHFAMRCMSSGAARPALAGSACAHQGAQWVTALRVTCCLAVLCADRRCISWGPDPEGVNGVFLGKDVPLQVGGGCRPSAAALCCMSSWHVGNRVDVAGWQGACVLQLLRTVRNRAQR